MKFVLIFGPQAVRKMTVGQQQLERLTGLKLFHNHMTIELVAPFFSYGSPQGKRLVNLFRQKIFEEVSKSDLEGLIFTYVWAFDLESDWAYVRGLCELFESRGATVYFVELEADMEERLVRNRSEHRLQHKPTKRNFEFSENDLIQTANRYRLNSYDGEISVKNYLRINNTNLSPEETANQIKDYFGL